MSREAHVRFCEGPQVKFLRSTHPMREDASTIRKDNAPENLSLLKKIILNILRTDTSGRKKLSLRIRRKRAAWDDDLRAQLLGLTPL